jgi:hypothetical protein
MTVICYALRKRAIADERSNEVEACETAAMFAVLWILLSHLQLVLPKIPWTLLFLATLTYGISLLFSVNLPAFRRCAIAYLVLVGLTYFLAGLVGLFRNAGLIATLMWDSLITPFPLLALIDQCFLYHPCKLSQTSFSSLPVTDDPQLFFSLAAMVVSLIAVVAAFLLAKENKIASRIWLAMVVFSFAEAFGYVLADSVNWGSPRATGTPSRDSVLPLCWAASYLVAYLIIRLNRTRTRDPLGQNASLSP